MRLAASLVAVLLALAFTACGGGDDSSTTSTTGDSGASGAQGSTASADMTAGEFIDASIPDEIDAVQQAVDENSDCSGVDASPGSDFQVNVAIDAASATPDTPISEVVADNC